jgi:hypothetical protein
MKLALRTSSSLFDNLEASIFEECDPELAGEAMPADLKIMEGLLKNDPENKKILTILSMGFSGYSMLFLEDQAPERASRFYFRALNYGLRALGDRGRKIKDRGLKNNEIQAAIKSLGRDHFEALFWTAVSWSAWINLNLDEPSAFAQLNRAQACLERVLEIDADYLYGFPYILMGVNLAALPKMFGGNVEEARSNFEKALSLSNGKFLLAQYYFARYYAPRAQEKSLFHKLLKDIQQGDPGLLRDVCLINTMIQRKAINLEQMTDELFY